MIGRERKEIRALLQSNKQCPDACYHPLMPALYTLIFILTPAAIIWLTHRYTWAARVGVILLCYLAGLIVGNVGLVPEAALGTQQGLSELSVALALPMLLFTLDVRAWRHVAGKALLSMLLATVSVTTIASLLYFLSADADAAASSRLAAMAVGVYTGGTPNLAAIKAGLDIPHAEYIVFHSVDTLVGAAYLMAMLTVGGPLFRRLLPAPEGGQSEVTQSFADDDDYRPLLQRDARLQLARITGLGILVLGVSMGISNLLVSMFSLESGGALTIVLLTTFGISLSFIPGIRRLELAYRLGMYLIYIFCFAVASMARLEDLLQADMAVVMFVLFAVFGSVTLHALFCRLAGVDSDTFMVTSVAAVASPPFVPLIARALGNPAMILSGMTTGIIGYALGNYLGITLGLLLQSL
jgi:uncharacterized membrane protein